MADYNSELPIRSQLPGQVLPDDIIVKVGDGTNPTTQLLGVDSSGRVTVKLDDSAGNGITSVTNGGHQALDVFNQNLAATPAGGTAAAYSGLIGGIYTSSSGLSTPLTAGQQAAVQLDANGRVLVVSQSSNDTNYGTVGSNTLRTAAQIGNATGAADFNYGTVGAQTLRTASQIGNATGAADFGAGATDAQTLRVSANQGVAAATAGAWPIKVTDGTSVAAVAPASTAATAIEPALVVALSPNSPLPAGTAAIGTVNVSNLPTTVDTNYGAVGASTIRTASQIGNATGAADFNNGATGAQTLRVAANLAVGGANVTVANPVPVTITSGSAGTPIQSYMTTASLAAGSSTTLTYTVPAGHTFSLERIWASASGKIKVVAQNGAVNMYAGFNSSANPNVDFTVTAPPTIAAAGTVNVIITNDDKAPFDVYATVEGNQIT